MILIAQEKVLHQVTKVRPVYQLLVPDYIFLVVLMITKIVGKK